MKKRVLLYNAKIWTMDENNTRHHNAWLLMEHGKIASIGEGKPPSCPNVIDAQGGVVTPGWIDAHSHLGLYEDGLGFEGADENEDTDPATPHLRALDGINPSDRAFREALEAGVTATAVSPGSANPIGGQVVLLKTMGRRVDDMVVRAPLAMKFALGENPKTVYHDKDETPVTRMATAALIREQLHKTREYIARKKRAQLDPDEAFPDYDMRLEALEPLLRGEIQMHIHAHRADDIFTALRIAKEFGLHPVLIHGTEAHLIADILASEGVPVVSGPYLSDRSKPELRRLTEASPGILSRAGVPTAITVDHPVLPLRHLRLAVLLAIREGMDEWQALRAVTAGAAALLGVSDRIGMLKAGMDADVVLWSGTPLAFQSRVEGVWVNGDEAYFREEDK